MAYSPVSHRPCLCAPYLKISTIGQNEFVKLIGRGMIGLPHIWRQIMELYIGNIPDDVDDYDLRKFFALSGGEVSFKVVSRDGGHNKARRYGLASFESDKLARQVIRRFHGAVFKDKRIVVRAFGHRNYSNERRALNWRDIGWNKTERRERDRRGMFVQGRNTVERGIAVFDLG